MHVGCCENCRDIDLIENLANGCPRCGGRMVSLGVDSVHWNQMNAEGKKSLVIRMLTEPEFRPEMKPESEAEEAKQAETRAELIRQADTRNEQVRQAEEVLEQARQTEEAVEQARQADLEAFTQQQSLNKPEEKEEYVFVCCKCSTIAAHDRSHDRYFCTECGSDMVDTGYSTVQWATLSREEKRRISGDAQIRHMASAINMASSGDTGSWSTQNIIDVIKDE